MPNARTIAFRRLDSSTELEIAQLMGRRAEFEQRMQSVSASEPAIARQAYAGDIQALSALATLARLARVR